MPAFAPGVDADETGLLVAWERTMSEWSDKLRVCVEYMGTESVHGTASVGAAGKFAPDVAPALRRRTRPYQSTRSPASHPRVAAGISTGTRLPPAS